MARGARPHSGPRIRPTVPFLSTYAPHQATCEDGARPQNPHRLLLLRISLFPLKNKTTTLGTDRRRLDDGGPGSLDERSGRRFARANIRPVLIDGATRTVSDRR